jgi:hypothetical protein
MKKVFLAITLFSLLLFAAQASAVDWTLTPSLVSSAEHYVKWKVVCTSNAAALTATDLVPLIPSRLLRLIQGETMMLMKVSPGTDAVIPNTTLDIILSDDEGDAIWTKTTISKDAISWHDLSEDIGAYLPLTGELYLTLNDIGDAGDQVTLYFITWREEQ